jgi:NADH-quinone oxidoreductase subunit L
LERFLAKSDVMLAHDELSTGFHFSTAVVLSLIGAIIGVGGAWLLYTRYADRLGKTWRVLTKSFYIDEIYWKAIAEPFRALGQFVANIAEPLFFEGSLRGVGKVSQILAAALQRMQSGQIRSYMAWMAAGAALLIAYFIF